MDIQMVAMGFGLGGAGGAILASFIGMSYMSTAFFFLGGILGVAACLMEDVNPLEMFTDGF